MRAIYDAPQVCQKCRAVVCGQENGVNDCGCRADLKPRFSHSTAGLVAWLTIVLTIVLIVDVLAR